MSGQGPCDQIIDALEKERAAHAALRAEFVACVRALREARHCTDGWTFTDRDTQGEFDARARQVVAALSAPLASAVSEEGEG